MTAQPLTGHQRAALSVVVATGEPVPLRGNAKLTAEAVAEIRIRRAAGESGADLAREFGISQACANKAAMGYSWRQVLIRPDVKRASNGKPAR